MGTHVVSWRIRQWTSVFCSLLFAALLLTGTNAVRAQETTQHFDIPAGALMSALDRFGEQSGLQVTYDPSLLQGKTAAGLQGELSATTALQQLLQGSGLRYRFLNAKTVAIYASPTASATSTTAPPEKKPTGQAGQKELPVQLQTVAVTGSRIRGAPPASPVIDISQEQMIQAGHTNLGEVIRSIPQNFSGGQNPGVEGGALGTNANFTGGSEFDLRGIGQDATLTLLNGHRLSYQGSFQGVDISAIPVAAVDRIEIVADGASAIYGSDAVAGVANVILKRDYNGASATARYGQAADGGDIQRQYDFVTGTTWSTGGFIATLDAENDSGVKAGQRSYTNNLPPINSLLSTNETRAAVVSLHQDAGPLATFSLDALYHRRAADRDSITGLYYETDIDNADYSIAPKLAIRLPAGWSLSINGLYGRSDSTTTQTGTTLSGAPGFYSRICSCNSISSIEMDSGGPLFQLPGGKARIALGAGGRENKFSYSPIEGKRHSYYTFLETFLPFVSPQQDVPFLRELSLSGAIRYEKYNDFGSVTTPKIGLIYAPTDDLDLKASWGKSFKAPTLIQEYQGLTVYLFPAALLGGAGYPANATTLVSEGGSHDLEPERATTWTTTLSVHPSSLGGFQADLSYFHIDYNDRVALPVPNLLVALSDPILQEFITPYPTETQQTALISGTSTGLLNLTGAEYDPNNVIGIVDDLYTNITSQRIHGLDLFASYLFDLGDGYLKLGGNMTWLNSRQRFSSLSPTVDLAGTVFNPPHFRARLGAVWQRGPLTLSSFYNYIGGVANTLRTPNVDGAPMRMLDVTALYHFGSDIDLLLSVQNITNEQPPLLKNNIGFVNYDSTNYPSIGRVVSISVTKLWK